MIGMGVESVLRVGQDHIGANLANLTHDHAHGLVPRQILDTAIRPVEPAQLTDAQVAAGARQLARPHLRQVLARRAVVAEDRRRLAARRADQHGAHAGLTVVRQGGTHADLVVGMGKNRQNRQRCGHVASFTYWIAKIIADCRLNNNPSRC